MTRPLLVVAHEATRSGGNRVLATLLRRTREQLPVPVAVRLLAGGSMAAELRSLATAPDPTQRPCAVLANSALAAGALEGFAPDVPCGVYVHEDDEGLAVLDEDARRAIRNRCDVVMCVSAGAADTLRVMGVEPERIRVVPPAVADTGAPDDRAVNAARRRMGATDADRLVVACGEVAWHKGPDLFVDLVARLRASSIRFAWIGRRPLGLGRVLAGDLATTGDAGRVVWTGEVPDAAAYLRAADVVVCTSRRDAQPLVPLEAALLGRPTAGFAVGGVTELGAEGCVATVEYPDTAALAATVAELLADPARSSGLVAAAAGRARRRQSPEVVGRAFVGELQRLIGAAA